MFMQVFRKVVGIDDGKDDVVESDPKYSFVKAAVETALSMVVMQPPMIICCPKQFVGDDIQEKQSGQWNESLQDGDYELQYLRPALYASYREEGVSKRAHVGNRSITD